MKTFNEKDLLTWSNRHTAKVGDKGYFADSITDLHSNMEAGYVHELMSIFDNNNRCFSNGTFSYGFFLPVDAVKEEKKYRACKTLKEMYELLNNGEFDMDENECIYQLIDFTVHTKNKQTGKEYYSIIASIAKDIDDTYKILIHGACYSLLSLFNNFEIEINGKWQPFGVEE